MRAQQLTPEVFAAFDAGDEYVLRRALKLPPWHASPQWDDLDGSPPYGDASVMINQTRRAALEIRREILAALRHTKREQANAG